MCGGTRPKARKVRYATGLSPRVRGEPTRDNGGATNYRVYPRVCGGTVQPLPGLSGLLGLSPRVRGNLTTAGGITNSLRSIPACAGEPLPNPTGHGYQRVYPRVCGGTASRIAVRSSSDGLSPRVRGNRYSGSAGQPAHGSIPACAGEPIASVDARGGVKVYPRVCGGTSARIFVTVIPYGLSPRVRGNRSSAYGGRAAKGSIPACAGEPTDRASLESILSVYPRVCGGTGDRTRTCDLFPGLSPRVRGNQTPFQQQNEAVRSIPACAGEPTFSGAVSLTSMVYPRVCGGTGRFPLRLAQTTGLSPRVRGNQAADCIAYAA